MRRARGFILAVVVLLVAGSLLTYLESEDPAATPTRSDAPRATHLPTSTPTAIPRAPSYAKIRSNFDRMTDTQWKAYEKTLRGKAAVDWMGWVENVDKEPLSSKYALYIDIDDPDVALSVYDVAINIPESHILAYNKDSQVRFSGIIDSVTPVLGMLIVRLTNTTIEVLP